MTHDKWHVTCGLCGWVKILSKTQVPSFFGLGVKESWRSLGKGWLTDSPVYTGSAKKYDWVMKQTPLVFVAHSLATLDKILMKINGSRVQCS